MRTAIAGLLFVAAMAMVAVTMPGFVPKARAADEAEIEAVVRKLLTEKPEIVIDAIRAYQAKEEAAKADRQRDTLTSHKDTIYNNAADPAIGSPDAKITLVEFFDYRCGYCKRSLQNVLDLVDGNPDVRVVFKELPILGPESLAATRVSLALQKVAPQHYRAFHTATMRHRGALTEDALMKIVAAAGADTAAVETAMKDPSVEETIRANHALAEALGIRGTPAFIIGDHVIPGAASLQTLEHLVDQQRS